VKAPEDPASALSWAKDAVANNHYGIAPKHLPAQLQARGFILDDVLHAISHSRRCEAYAGTSEHGGSVWRIHGPTLNPRGSSQGATSVSVGVETFWDEDAKEKRVQLITTFNPKTKGGKR
jgi:hypothetical protein